MEKNNMKNNLARIIACFIMLLFAVCSIVNVFFCADYNFYEFIDKTSVIETQPISEIVAVNEGDDNTACFEPSFLNNNSHIKTITKNTYLLSMIADVSKEFTLLLCSFFIFFFIFFILLPDRRTLINQKIRLDN